MQAFWIRLIVALVLALTALVSASGPGGVDPWSAPEARARQSVAIERIDCERKMVCAVDNHMDCKIGDCCVSCGVIAEYTAFGEHEADGPAQPRRPREFVSIAATPPVRPPRQREL